MATKLAILLKKPLKNLTAEDLRFIISNADDAQTVKIARQLLVLQHFCIFGTRLRA